MNFQIVGRLYDHQRLAPQDRLTLESPLEYLRECGYRIERLPDAWEWWRIEPPTNSDRKVRPKCTLRTIIATAEAEGWIWRLRQDRYDTVSEDG